ncbi:RNA polymerase sigma factor [Actinoplanes sp. NBRC 14428]|uniref:RNA polymerase sigma factor (Sigma-70 family) n=1 Tax=Pseudosporangium ferrugineum TaxID=439699 RepID=A0A2T0SIY0_9ACTN|nr:sigma-70 family RNA polymerase sigma factor [Pseudosporangium ferrugineum]PRY33323.1 RNA polymerase sigma factor (sigma-70 family) [Pseudosporangium ferrugineum]BCJ48677.1 RNA polymerase sigma factor [Actinoplanes sp. NBRC 14428]
MSDSEPDADMAVLVGKAAGGDAAAWDEIVRRYSGRVWAVCRVHRLSPADAADVFQQTWLRVLENLDSLRDPAKFGAWIGTTCRNEALAAIRRARRAQPVDTAWLLDRPGDPDDDPELPFLVADRDAELWQAFRQLSRRCRDVLRVLVVEAEGGRPSYELAAGALGMPIGSLGPTRGRCLGQLRRFLTEGIQAAGGGS